MAITTYPAFWNSIVINSQNNSFQTYVSGGAVGLVSHQLPTGSYWWDELRNQILTTVDENTDLAALKIGLSATGHLTLSHSQAFAFIFQDTDLRELMGFTSNMSAVGQYIASRRVRGAFYPSSYVQNFVPKSIFAGGVVQTKCLSGIVRTTLFGTKHQAGEMTLPFINGSKELASPVGSFGTTYVGQDITELYHAEHYWWAPDDNQQGWGDGRPVRYIPDVADCTIALLGSAATLSTGDYTTWIVEQKDGGFEEHCRPMYPPQTIWWNMKIKLVEYVSPG